MNIKEITLASEKELKIFMDPIRQRILRAMEIAGPMTSKRIADELGMTPASAKHHLTQLESIGLVELDHTEMIHGITAKYYRAVKADIKLGMGNNEFLTEKIIIAENQVTSVFKDLTASVISREPNDQSTLPGDCITGVVHLTEQQYQEFNKYVQNFFRKYQVPSQETKAYEVALVFCEAKL
jgi:DNA-binding Lrp family transcriptional regulator